jgi:hypothetical protein
MKINEEVQYIWHDGATIPENLLINMAKNAGSYVVAEHCLISYYRHILAQHGLGDYINKENEVRSHYNVANAPMPKVDSKCESWHSQELAKNDLARKRYTELNYEMRVMLLKESLRALNNNHKDLFASKVHWLGIYLVIHDRLDGAINRTSFVKLADAIKPEEWAEDLAIGENTMTNFAHYVDYNDRKEAYYDMENNPWEALCSTFWNVLRQIILTRSLLNDGVVY